MPYYAIMSWNIWIPIPQIGVDETPMDQAVFIPSGVIKGGCKYLGGLAMEV